MRIARVHIVNFRCLKELEISLEDVTVLVGANGTGKSTLLQALRWFFEGGDLEPEDHAGHQTDRPITVGVTFTDFNAADREALGSYVLGEEATFWRTWASDHGEKLTGKGRAFPPFNEVRKHEKATPKRDAYKDLCDEQPELGLPKASSAAQVDEALDAWERDHPDRLEDSRVDATHLFGFTGGSRLNGRFDFVLVPAVSDPEAETRDARGTLLRQLLDRALGEQSKMREKLSELEGQISQDMHQIMVAEGGEALRDLAAGVTADLGRLVPGGAVLLEAGSPAFRVPELSVEVRVADGELETDVGRQGHGFQRALLIAVVQRLAATPPSQATEDESSGSDGAESPPALFLALEEPELYQHPLQARHFASTLASLADATGSPAQVAYATHSEHFVDPGHYQRLRRFQRLGGTAWPETDVKRATVARVAERLKGAYDSEQVAVRVRMTLRRQVAEAVFANAVVLVEGNSDAGLLHGIADREGGLDALGVAAIEGHGKRQLLIPWAILTELGVPTYVVFDADGGLVARRMSDEGWEEEKAIEAQKAAQAENLVVQRVLGLSEEAAPATSVEAAHTVFADMLEAECAEWQGFQEAVDAAREELGDFRKKSDDAYRQAARTLSSDPPPVFQELLARVRDLVT